MRLLLAEDDKTSRDLLRRIMESEAHVVVLAQDGDEAWRNLSDPDPNNVFDACILDICMPELSGLELIERMRSTEALKHTPVILCTAVHDRHTVQKAATLGVAHYVIKPYRRDVMLEKLRLISQSKQVDMTLLEPAAEVCQRLGIDAAFHRDMIVAVLNEAGAVISDARGMTPDFPKLFLRIRGLKGSCLTFGLKGAVHRLDPVEALVQNIMTGRDSLPDFRGRLTALMNDFENGLQGVRTWVGTLSAAS